MPSTSPSSAVRLGGRHHKIAPDPALRRAAVIAVVAPVAGMILAGPSAFAAGKADDGKAGTTELNAAEQKITDNLNTRSQDTRLGSTLSGVVIDAKSDKVVWGHDADTALMAASNTKLATSTAALTVLGPDHRLTTKVVYGDGTLTLVGAGDRPRTTDDLDALARYGISLDSFEIYDGCGCSARRVSRRGPSPRPSTPGTPRR